MATEPEEILQTVLTHDYKDWTLNICLAARPESEDDTLPEFQIMGITDMVRAEFGRTIASFTRSNLRWLTRDRLSVSPYDPGSASSKYAIEYLDLSDAHAGTIKEQLAKLQPVESVNQFASEKNFIERLRYYVLIAEREGFDPVYFFRQFTESQELGKSKLFGLFLLNGYYDEYKELFFIFDKGIDCVCSQGTLFVSNKMRFQQIFSLDDVIKEIASEVMTRLEKVNLISDYEKMKEDLGKNFPLTRKVAGLYAADHLDTLEIGHLQSELKRVPTLNAAISVENGQIIYSLKSLPEIVRLISGDYYKSEVTRKQHLANSKKLVK